MTHPENIGFVVRYDTESRILHTTYGPVVSGDITARMYAAGIKIAHEVGVENIRAMIIDFRSVQRFDKGNLASAQRNSVTVNQKWDLSSIPVALVVETAVQEQMVRIVSKITPDQRRKRIVRSMKEAHQFIDEWYQESAEV